MKTIFKLFFLVASVLILASCVRNFKDEAKLLFDKKQYAQAIEMAHKVLALEPRDFFCMYTKARALEELGKFSEAAEVYGQAIKIDPEHSDSYLGRGRCNLKLEKFKSAVIDFKNSIDRKPKDNSEAYYLKGRAYLKLEEYFDAYTALTAAIEMNPEHPTIHYYRGMCRALYFADAKGAIYDFSKVLEKNSKSYVVYMNRAKCYESISFYEEAYKDYKAALTYNDTLSTAYIGAGFCALQLGNKSNACELFKKAKNNNTALAYINDYCY